MESVLLLFSSLVEAWSGGVPKGLGQSKTLEGFLAVWIDDGFHVRGHFS